MTGLQKKIIVLCGGGVATSVMATSKINEFLKKKGLNAVADYKRLDQLATIESNGIADMYVVMTMTNKKFSKPAVNGVPLVTMIGADKVYDQIEAILNETDG